MKYMIYLLAAIYIIWWYYIINVFFLDDKINIEKIKESVVIVEAKNEIINYSNNPKWLFENKKTPWIGAWFFINNRWEIQTVSHILWKENFVIYKWKKYKSKIIQNDKKNDLAILKINTTNKVGLAPWNLDNIELGTWNLNNIDSYLAPWNLIYSFWTDTKNKEIIFNTWVLLNKKSKLENKSNLLEISNTLKPGFSWWPIINSKWEVIWINYAISNGKNYWIIFK